MCVTFFFLFGLSINYNYLSNYNYFIHSQLTLFFYSDFIIESLLNFPNFFKYVNKSLNGFFFTYQQIPNLLIVHQVCDAFLIFVVWQNIYVTIFFTFLSYSTYIVFLSIKKCLSRALVKKKKKKKLI